MGWALQNFGGGRQSVRQSGLLGLRTSSPIGHIGATGERSSSKSGGSGLSKKEKSQRQELLDSCEARRRECIDEAIKWPGGTQEAREFVTVYQAGAYEVRLGKPGKEAARKDRPNPNDMLPCVFYEGSVRDYKPTFTQILKALLEAYQQDPETTRLLGNLLLRCAYMESYQRIPSGVWRLVLPEPELEGLRHRTPSAGGLPIDVFIHLLDAVALNEDVKYAASMPERLTRKGRPNNLLMYVYFLAMLLGAIDQADLVGSMASGRGVARLKAGTAARAEAAFRQPC